MSNLTDVTLQSFTGTAQWDSEIKTALEYKTSTVAADQVLQKLLYYSYLSIKVRYMYTIHVYSLESENQFKTGLWDMSRHKR